MIVEALKVKPGFLLDGEGPADDDALQHEVRDVLSSWDGKQRRAILKAAFWVSTEAQAYFR